MVVIVAHEEREIENVDVPNLYIYINNPKEVGYQRDIIKVGVKLAQILVDISTYIYGYYITYENGKSVLYLELLKALYGMLISSLLFYQKLRKDLKSINFKVNPYDPFMANKIIRDKQMTITWHVYDLKVSHSDKDVFDDFI